MSGSGGGEDMSRVLDMLRSLYPYVQTLEEFTDGIVFREGRKVTVIEEGDTERFKASVRGVLVCTDTKLQQVASCNQICTLPELLAFVLNNLKRRKRRNVLSHGYSSSFAPLAQQARDLDQFKFQGNIIQSAAYVHGSTLWKKMLKRLGTDITRYLLESCSLFVSVPPSCVFQVCGVPVYDRISIAPGSRFCRHPRNRTTGGGKLSQTKTGERRNGSKRNKRKRGRCAEQDQCLTRPAKRPRTGDFRLTEITHQVCAETANDNVQFGTAEMPAAVMPSEVQRDSSKQAVQTPSTSLTFDEGPSWRSGRFPPPPAARCFIRMLGMLYGGRGMRGFHLNRKKRGGAEGPRRIQGTDLVRIIFFEGVAYLNGLERKPKKLPLRFFNMVRLFSRLLRHHRRCPYNMILQRMCPLDKDAQAEDMGSLLLQHCAPHRVYLFIRECLSKVVPQELWGSDHNKAIFLARVRGFLRNSKNERLSLAELMWKMKVNDCDWLKISKTGRVPPCELAYRTQVLGQYLAWLLDGYVLGLVRSFFYVTESAGQKHALRFYRQEVWAKLQDLAFRVHLTKGQMNELTPNEVASLPKDTVTSRLRFIPKPGGMRPITRIIGSDIKTRVYQAQVRNLLDMLRACVHSTPSLLGATVHGNTDIHKVLRSLAPAQKDKPQLLYFVKVDVSGAYESLPHAKLLDVIQEILSPVQDEAFTIRRYAKIWTEVFSGGLKKSFVNWADFGDDENNIESSNMKGFAMSLQREGKVKSAILVEQSFSSDLHGRDALKAFNHMLKGSVIQYMKRTFRQCRGIPQGSVVSCLLCCLCYAHMERLLFKNITDNGGCLMRLVDDFLLITPHLHQAETFLQTCLKGVPQYGLVANPQKILVNFEVCGNTDVHRLPPHSLFPWCGLLLNTHTLDVYYDYTSYAGMSLRYSLTLGFTHSAGQQMKSKLMGVLRLKCHTLFLDLKSNSIETVYKNIYKLVLLHAYRFHVCAQSLPFGQNVAKNPVYFLQIIWDMAKYTNRLIRISNKGMRLGSKDQTGVLQYEAVELIYCLSFVLVLTRHRPLYKALLPHLHRRKRVLERRLGALRLARVRQAATPRIPEEFGAIQTS